MLLKLTHTTNLQYSDLIKESVMELRMAPRQELDQHRLSFTLAVGPPTAAFSYFDWLGNTVHWFTVNPSHRQIRIVATSVVETDRQSRHGAEARDTWPPPLPDSEYTLYDFLQFGGPVLDSPRLRELVERAAPRHGERLSGLGTRTLDLIASTFTYEKGTTTAASPIDDILEHGGGVCQDFTHLMVGLGRAMGIPSRYVSGLIHPDQERYRGFTQTHAWCEWLFPSVGWVGFDPANNCSVGDNFVKVAIGRDYRDVPPNKGQYTGVGTEVIEVAVESQELKAIPSELAAERIQSLQIPSYPEGRVDHSERATQQSHEQQQQ